MPLDPIGPPVARVEDAAGVSYRPAEGSVDEEDRVEGNVGVHRRVGRLPARSPVGGPEDGGELSHGDGVVLVDRIDAEEVVALRKRVGPLPAGLCGGERRGARSEEGREGGASKEIVHPRCLRAPRKYRCIRSIGAFPRAATDSSLLYQEHLVDIAEPAAVDDEPVEVDPRGKVGAPGG